MAILSSPLGKIRGHIGSLSFYSNAQGDNLCRSSGYRRKRSNDRQQAWEGRFAAVAHAAPYLQEALLIGFPGNRDFPAGLKGFVKANIRTATESLAEANGHKQFTLIFEQLKLSAGQLEVSKLQTTMDSDRSHLTLTHRADLTEDFFRFCDDRIYAVAVSEDLSYAKPFSLGCRSENGEQTIIVSPDTVNLLCPIHLYAFATTADGKQASDTLYLGKWI